ncbi:MAG: threonine synthase [Candidatus Micrarchaeia archaeon]
MCPKCGGILEVEYIGKGKAIDSDHFWDFESLLPKGYYRHFEVGSTRLLQSHDDKSLFLKLEFESPTRSFKDRGSVIEVAKAKEYGYSTIACASTGNMAFSIAYFAKLYGIKAAVFISRSANKDKVLDIKNTHDAELHKIDGDFTKAQNEAAKYAKEHGAFLAGDYCYRKEGQSTIGFELAHQAKDAANVIMPIGNGTLFSAVYKAYSRLVSMRLLPKIPRLIGVQAELSAPIVHSKGGTIKYEKPRTKADAIAVGYPTYGMQVVEAIKSTNGLALTVSDTEMTAWQKKFESEYGLQAELAGVASLAAYAKLKGKLKGKTVALITGANL